MEINNSKSIITLNIPLINLLVCAILNETINRRMSCIEYLGASTPSKFRSVINEATPNKYVIVEDVPDCAEMFDEMMQINGYKIFQKIYNGLVNTSIAEEKTAAVGLDVPASVYINKPVAYFELIGALDNTIQSADQERGGI